MQTPSTSPTDARRRPLLAALGLGTLFPFLLPASSRADTMTLPAATTTLFNVFTVATENSAALVALLQEGTDAWIRRIPGFVSSTLHVARDGRRVVIVGRWTSEAAIGSMRRHAEMPAYFTRIERIATMETMTCDAVSVALAPTNLDASAKPGG